MRIVEQHAFDLPDVRLSQPPVVVPHLSIHIDDRVAGEAPGVINVRVGVAQGQRSWRGEDRQSPVQTGIAGSRHRSPSTLPLIQKDDVIKMVDRFEAEDERGVTVLFEGDGGKERGFETMCAAGPYDTAKAPQGRPAVRFLVVRQAIEVSLNVEWCPKTR